MSSAIIRLAIQNWLASSSLGATIMANSYLKVASTPPTLKMAIKKAKTPKSSGVYTRDNSGEMSTGIACAMVVPANKVAKFLTKEFFKLIPIFPL